MRKRFLAGVVAAAAVGITALAPATASATGSSGATLADVLLADSSSDDANGFDRRWWDYDIVTQAVLLFPDLVDAASNPEAELTVFLPNDAAFRQLVFEITGKWMRSEADVFAAVASLGLPTVETVLTYHIVGAEIAYRDALRSDGATLTTLQGGSIDVDVKRFFLRFVQLIDADTNDRDPIVIQGNVGGKAANGYAHGIDRVLRPIDLP
jgi:Secreted and surface protein containing fasciclin-like repeats